YLGGAGARQALSAHRLGRAFDDHAVEAARQRDRDRGEGMHVVMVPALGVFHAVFTERLQTRISFLATLDRMYEVVLTRRRVLVGAAVATVVLLLGARFLLQGPSASTALERPIVGSAEVGGSEEPS